ncbi:MAG TPA: OmpA family protein [Stenotrophomonas sp.]|nr:OmpA family protein [Stenotrophomonas sp.]
MNKANKQALILLMLAPMVLAMGCTRHVSRGLTDEGEVQEVVYPDESKLVRKGGSIPNLDNLRMLGEGLNKEQLRGLIGSPHFREGVGAREWDYLFQLPTTANQTLQCRFKVIFNSRMMANKLYWAPEQCAELVAASASVAASSAPAAPQMRQFSLSTDILFPFGKGAVQDMNAAGRERVVQIAADIRGADDLQVRVLGYTDRIGNEQSNLSLSQRRADAVREVLVGAGVPAAAVSARGLGETHSSDCSKYLPNAELAACLAPDRRVEIQVSGTT